jgi:hypothetical protein
MFLHKHMKYLGNCVYLTTDLFYDHLPFCMYSNLSWNAIRMDNVSSLMETQSICL